MILINLLPHREAARKQRREAFSVALALAILVGVLISGVVYSWYQAQIQGQQSKNIRLKTEISKLETKIKEIAELQKEISALRARQNAVEELQRNRNVPVYLLTELVTQLPDGVYITSMKQENETVSITGISQSNERVSELLRNLANGSQWLTRPELIEITGSTVALTSRDQRRVANFSMRLSLKRASDEVKPGASAPSGPAQAAGAAPIQAASAAKV